MSFSAQDNLAGNIIACPKCRELLTIPSAQQAARGQKSAPATGLAGLFDEVGIKEHLGSRCPQCSQPLKQGAILCVSCGYHLQEARKITTDYSGSEEGHERRANSLLKKAEIALEVDKIEAKKNRSQGAPWWVFFIALSTVLGFAITMFMLPPEDAFRYTGFIIMGFGGLLLIVISIRLIMIAFSESSTCGILCILFWPYALYYVLSRWDQCGALFMMSIGAFIVVLLGVGAYFLSPMMASKGEGEVGLTRPPIIRHVEHSQLFGYEGLRFRHTDLV